MSNTKKLKRHLVKAIFLGAIVATLVLTLCYFRTDKDVRDFMQSLSRIDGDVRRNGLTDAQQYAKVHEAISSSMGRIQGAEKLRELFYACQKKSHRYVYFSAQTEAIFRLADMHDDASARVLVELISDKDLSWDGESWLNIREALIRCGRPCVPYLSVYSGENGVLAHEVLAMIQAVDGCPE